MAESGFNVLEKVFADRQIVTLSSLVKDEVAILPVPFRNAVAIQIRQAECERQMPTQQQQQQPQHPNLPVSQLLDWYQLTELCDSILLMKGLRDKWHLPCLVTTANQLQKACECPFIPHSSRSDWEALHTALGTSKMRWLLTHCSLFILTGMRAWLQISGPLDKGGLDKAFPFNYTFAQGAGRSAKRKRKEDQEGVIMPSAESIPAIPSVQRPLKKIRLQSANGQRMKLLVVENTGSPIDEQKEQQPSLIPRLKKVRIERRDSLPTVNSPSVKIVPQLDDDVKPSDPAVGSLQEVDAGTTRRGRRCRRRNKSVRVQQIVDKRRAIDGSIHIPHDEILYSGSGWTHFPITHPLFRSSHKEAVTAILKMSVGTECRDDVVDLSRLGQLIEVMARNHRKCRYTPILRRMLSSDPYDAQKSSVDADRVHQFIKCVVKKVVPLDLLGGSANQKMFLSTIGRFVRAGRGTAFTLNDLIQSMRTSRCRWLSHLSSLPVQISLLARLITWLFLDFIKPLIRQHFYATETTHGRNRIFFYSKDVWQRIHHRMMRSICAVSLRQPLPVLKNSTADLSVLENLLLRARLRFVPKKNGSRPIMSTVFRRVSRKQVTSTRLLLHNISGFYSEGMDAKSTHSLHRKWVHFLQRVRPIQTPIYFVHADVEDAFGSIHHDKMVDILRDYREKLPRTINVRSLCHVNADGRRSKTFQILPYFYRSDPVEWVQRLAPGSVVFDLGMRAESLDTAKLIEFAIQSIREVHVMHNSKSHYRLARGIPQGSRLSSALCHIYYGHMVQEHLSEFLNHADDLLIRVVDDFLYLTPSSERARAFHQRIHEGFADYNAYVNITKSATNLDLIDHSNQPAPIKKPIWNSFCGLQFNTRTLEIRGDYAKYEGTDIIHCITPSAGNPGKLLLKRLQGISTLKIEVNYIRLLSLSSFYYMSLLYRFCLLTFQTAIHDSFYPIFYDKPVSCFK